MINKIPYLLIFLFGLIAGVSLTSFYFHINPTKPLPTKCTIVQGINAHEFECLIEIDHGRIAL